MKSSLAALVCAVWCLASCGGSQPVPASDAVQSEAPATVLAPRCTGELSFDHPRDRFEQGDACDVIDERWAAVTDADRACAADADCALVSGACFTAALSTAAAREARFAETPCPGPSGMCPPPDPGTAARCIRGCCVAVAP